jgi:hypothetical protein
MHSLPKVRSPTWFPHYARLSSRRVGSPLLVLHKQQKQEHTQQQQQQQQQ